MNADGGFGTEALVMIAVCAGALGALMSLSLPIFVFLLAIACGALVVLCGALLRGLPVAQVFLFDGGGVAAAQIGYVFGLVAQALISPVRRHGENDE